MQGGLTEGRSDGDAGHPGGPAAAPVDQTDLGAGGQAALGGLFADPESRERFRLWCLSFLETDLGGRSAPISAEAVSPDGETPAPEPVPETEGDDDVTVILLRRPKPAAPRAPVVPPPTAPEPPADPVLARARFVRNKRRLLRALDGLIARIDRAMSDQVSAVLHHPRFQRLEASWRGVGYLVARGQADRLLRVKVLDVSWSEVCRDLDRAVEFDQSALFDIVYSQEFGMPGGEPHGILIGDYQVQHRPTADHRTDDVAALRGMSGIAAAAFAPFVVGAAPALLGLEDFGALGGAIELGSTFEGPEYQRFRSLRQTEDARFLAITVPRMLMRPPHRDDGALAHGFRFHERHGGASNADHLWGNAAFAFAGVVMRAFAASAWLADIKGARRDEEAGGLVPPARVEYFQTDAPGVAVKYQTDVLIGDLLDSQLSEMGLMAMTDCKYTPDASFNAVNTIQIPKVYDRTVATVNARISSMCHYILCVSRFAHYVKVVCRDKVGSFKTAGEHEAHIGDWLRRYCVQNDDASDAIKARSPLREGRVTIQPIPGKPASYGCTIHLQPHYQLDEIQTVFRLSTEVAGKTAA